MLFTNHMLAGALLGRVVRKPGAAFAAGLASHVVMDVLPHWGRWDEAELLRVARVDGLVALALSTGAVAGAGGTRSSTIAAMAGAGLLDLDKPGRHFVGRSPFPRVVDRWHAWIQVDAERRTRWWAEAVAAGTLAAALAQTRRRTVTVGPEPRARRGPAALGSRRPSRRRSSP